MFSLRSVTPWKCQVEYNGKGLSLSTCVSRLIEGPGIDSFKVIHKRIPQGRTEQNIINYYVHAKQVY